MYLEICTNSFSCISLDSGFNDKYFFFIAKLIRNCLIRCFVKFPSNIFKKSSIVFIISLLNGRTRDSRYEIVFRCHILRHISHIYFDKKEQSIILIELEVSTKATLFLCFSVPPLTVILCEDCITSNSIECVVIS